MSRPTASRAQVLTNHTASRRTLHPRTIRLVQTSLAVIALVVLVAGVIPPRCYQLDLQVEYLAAHTWLAGGDPFRPLTEMATRYFPVPVTNFPHPNPHPPVLALLAVPLTLLPFPVLAVLWLAFNLLLLIKVGGWLGFSARASLALALWPPLLNVLSIGQMELVVLVLAMLGWRAAAARRDWRAGVWLGCAAAIKLYPAFFLVPFALRRRGRIIAAAALVIVASQVGGLVAVGYSGLVRYYTEILPSVSDFYAHTVLNSAPYGALLRLFHGATDVPPLVQAPGIVVPLALLLSLGALAALALLTPEAAPVAVLVALPMVWNYAVVLALPQIVALLRDARAYVSTLLIVAAASFTVPLASAVVRLTALLLPQHFGSASGIAALVMAVQAAGFVGLLLLQVERSRGSRPVALSKEEPQLRTNTRAT